MAYSFFDAKPAIKVTGGIRSQGKLKGNTWWATRWMQVLEHFYVGERLARGRSYARRGQVISIDIATGRVEAKVQGSRPKPYKVAITLKPLSTADWTKAVAALQEQAGYAARLLNGELPQEVEQVFERLDLALFPKRKGDLETECSCPDWSNPCKHVAAVFYLIGEEFDRDPFLIFRLRGLERSDLSSSLKATEPYYAPESLSTDPARFWGPTDAIPQILETPKGTGQAALVRQLGTFPFWRGETRFIEEIVARYPPGARRAAALLARLADDAP